MPQIELNLNKGAGFRPAPVAKIQSIFIRFGR